MKNFLLLLLLTVWGCSAAPTVIETKPVKVQPPPIVVNNASTVPYVVPPDTTVEPSGITLITPVDSGYVAQDSTNGAKVVIRIHFRGTASPMVSLVANPPPAVAMHTDTVSGKIQTVKEPLSAFEIILMTAGGLAIFALLAYAVGRLKPL